MKINKSRTGSVASAALLVVLVAVVVSLSVFIYKGVLTHIPPTNKIPTIERNDGAKAMCEDGYYSYSHKRSGTCSGHGGVKEWL